MPMMALSGVRNSWLILAKNSLLVRLAASAASFSLSKRSKGWVTFANKYQTSIKRRQATTIRPSANGHLLMGALPSSRRWSAAATRVSRTRSNPMPSRTRARREPKGGGRAVMTRLHPVARWRRVEPSNYLTTRVGGVERVGDAFQERKRIVRDRLGDVIDAAGLASQVDVPFHGMSR